MGDANRNHACVPGTLDMTTAIKTEPGPGIDKARVTIPPRLNPSYYNDQAMVSGYLQLVLTTVFILNLLWFFLL